MLSCPANLLVSVFVYVFTYVLVLLGNDCKDALVIPGICDWLGRCKGTKEAEQTVDKLVLCTVQIEETKILAVFPPISYSHPHRNIACNQYLILYVQFIAWLIG